MPDSALYNVKSSGKKAGVTGEGLPIWEGWFSGARDYLSGASIQKNEIRGARGLFFPTGYAYKLGPNETLELQSKQTLLGLGPQSLLHRDTHSTKPMIHIKNATAASIRDLVLDAGKMESDCIRITSPSKSISIENVTCRHAKVGIQVEGKKDIRIIGCELYHNTNNIQIGTEPFRNTTPSFVQDMLISNCIIRDALKVNPDESANGILIWNQCKNLTLDGNIIKENQDNGIALYASGTQITISNNEVRGNLNHGIDILADYENYILQMGWQNESLSLIANRISENKGDGVRIHGLSPSTPNPYKFLSSTPNPSPTKEESQRLGGSLRIGNLRTFQQASQNRLLRPEARTEWTVGPGDTEKQDKEENYHLPFLKKANMPGMRESTLLETPRDHFLSANTGSSTFIERTFTGVPFDEFKIKKPDFAAVQMPPDVEFQDGIRNVKIWSPDITRDSETPWYESFQPTTPFNIMITGNQIAENEQHGVFNQAPFVSLVGNLITDNARSKDRDYYGVYFQGGKDDEDLGRILPNGLITNNIFVNNGRDVPKSQSAGLCCDNTENIQISCNTFNRDSELDRSTPSQRYAIILRKSLDILISTNHFGDGYVETDALKSDNYSHISPNKNSFSYTSVNNIGLRSNAALRSGESPNPKSGELVYVPGIRHLAYYNSSKKKWVYLKQKRLKQG